MVDRAARVLGAIALTALMFTGTTATAQPHSQARQVQARPAPTIGRPAPSARDVGLGDPLRPVLLNALRPTVVADLGQPVKFVVSKLRTQGDWAFVVARPQQPDGREIDFRRTRHRERIEQGIFDGPILYALMRRQNQSWVVLDYVIGPTDVHFSGWPSEFGAPAALLGLSPDRL